MKVILILKYVFTYAIFYLQDCVCGYNYDCQFDYSGQKQCNCKSGYGMKKGRCTGKAHSPLELVTDSILK